MGEQSASLVFPKNAHCIGGNPWMAMCKRGLPIAKVRWKPYWNDWNGNTCSRPAWCSLILTHIEHVNAHLFVLENSCSETKLFYGRVPLWSGVKAWARIFPGIILGRKPMSYKACQKICWTKLIFLQTQRYWFPRYWQLNTNQALKLLIDNLDHELALARFFQDL